MVPGSAVKQRFSDMRIVVAAIAGLVVGLERERMDKAAGLRVLALVASGSAIFVLSLGKVEDYMLGVDRGCIEYAVLSFGGFLGIGEKLFAIQWQSMTLDTENHAWRIGISQERLDQHLALTRTIGRI